MECSREGAHQRLQVLHRTSGQKMTPEGKSLGLKRINVLQVAWTISNRLHGVCDLTLWINELSVKWKS